MPFLSLGLLALVAAPQESVWDAQMVTVFGAEGWDYFGFEMTELPDLNGDGVTEVFTVERVGDAWTSPAVGVRSGVDLSQLKRWELDSGWRVIDLDWLGDLDGDGDGELGVLCVELGNRPFDGLCYIYSESGERLAEQLLDGSYFPNVIEGLGDLNGDGLSDFAIGYPFGGQRGGGRVDFYLGGSLRKFHSMSGAAINEEFGSSIASLEDQTGDGTPEILIGQPGVFARATLFDPSDWSVLGVFDSASVGLGSGFGGEVEAFPDLDGDGREDFIVSTNYGRVSFCIYSSATHAVLLRFQDPHYTDSPESAYAVDAGDRNGDGIPDVLATLPGYSVNPFGSSGLVRIISGADGSLLESFEASHPWWDLGRSLARIWEPSLHASEVARFAVGSTTREEGRTVLVGWNPQLTLSRSSISLSAGGSVDAKVNFPRELAGRPYRILASSSGTGPTLIGVEIPLTADRVFWRTAWAVGSRFAAAGWTGRLDPSGDADAVFRAAPMTWLELQGNYHLAAVALGWDGVPVASSVARALELLP